MATPLADRKHKRTHVLEKKKMTENQAMTPPKLDASMAEARRAADKVTRALHSEVEALRAALATERARANQAAEKAWDDGYMAVPAEPEDRQFFVEDAPNPYRAAPTAEQANDPNRCPSCRHAEHDGFECLNMASDNDCACTYAAIPTANH